MTVKNSAATNILHTRAYGERKPGEKYKVAPDQKGVDVDLSDVHRTKGDSEYPPEGTSHFMFGIDKDSAAGGYKDRLTDFAAGFTRQCLQNGMSYGSFRQAVKQASAIDGVGCELACLEKCSSAVAGDFEKVAIHPGAVAAWNAVKGVWPKALAAAKTKGPQAWNWLKGLRGTAAATSKAAPAAGSRAAPAAGSAGTAMIPYNPGTAMIPYKPSTALIPAAGGSIAKIKPGWMSRAWNSGIGHGLRGSGVGYVLGGAADAAADFAGWENYRPNFSTLGAIAGGGARFGLPGMRQYSALTHALRQAGLSTRYATLPQRLFQFSSRTPAQAAKLKGFARLAESGKFNLAAQAASIPLGINLPWLARGRYALPGNIQRGIFGAGAVGATLHGMSNARGEERAREILDQTAQRFGSATAEELMQKPWAQFMQAYSSPEGGLLPGVRAYWGALTPEQKAMHLGGGAALLGGGAMLAGGHGLSGAAMMGAGGLGLAHGMGAFGSTPGSAESIYNSAPADIKTDLANFMQHPEFLQMGPAQQAELMREIMKERAAMQPQKSQVEMATG